MADTTSDKNSKHFIRLSKLLSGVKNCSYKTQAVTPTLAKRDKYNKLIMELKLSKEGEIELKLKPCCGCKLESRQADITSGDDVSSIKNNVQSSNGVRTFFIINFF